MKKILKKWYYRFCSFYFVYQIYDFLQKLTGYKKERNIIFKLLGYYPDYNKPQSFNEKVLWKKIYDRNPLLPIVSDKYLVRKYIRDILGDKKADEILIPLLYVTDKPQAMKFNDLKGEFIIKANHECGKYILAENIEGKRIYTVISGKKIYSLPNNGNLRKELISICLCWLSNPYGFKKHEWAYQRIKRKIIVEKLLRDDNGKIPDDYKFSIFQGKCGLIQVYYNRFINLTRGWYTPNWEYIDIKGAIKMAPYAAKPGNLESMIELAELLGKDFDFIRVDLYSVGNRIYFGELTNYPMSGRTPFHPFSFDFELGKKWKINPGYWKYKKYGYSKKVF